MDILDNILKESNPISETKDFDSRNFKKNFLNKKNPVLLKGYANNWKAKQHWNLEFLSNLKTDQPVQLEVGNVIQNETNFFNADFKSYIEQLRSSEIDTKKDKPYLSQFNIFEYFPELKNDVDLSIFTKYTKMDFPGAWIGPSGTISGFHYDLQDNLLTQIMGKKMLLLASPEYKKEMYVSKKYDFDAVGSQVDINNYDENKYPKFKNIKFYSVLLEPGDSIYIPKGWWHYVKSLDASISVSNFGYFLKEIFTTYALLWIQVRLHMRGLYRTKQCTCHVLVDGKRVKA